MSAVDPRPRMANDSPVIAAVADAWRAMALFALDPPASGGVLLRAPAGPVRDRWMADLRALLPQSTPWRVIPVHADVDRLLGGIDIAATLQRGRPVLQRGLLVEADRGIVVLPMAERASRSTVALLADALDTGAVTCARHGIDSRESTSFGIVALDEGEGDELTSATLRDRLAFHVDLRAIAPRDLAAALAHVVPQSHGDAVAAAAGRTRPVPDSEVVEALCSAAVALGIDSIRASVLAVRVAGLSATLDAKGEVDAADAAMAARLVLAPRAVRFPSSSDEAPPDRSDEGKEPSPPPDQEDTSQDPKDASLEEVVLEAAKASIPAGLLARLQAGPVASRGAAGRVGAHRVGLRRGRPLGVRRGRPSGGARLDLIATLRAAAPWQAVRGRQRPVDAQASPVRIRSDDFRIGRFQERSQTTTIFAVDASGSAALHRLAEAKGAVELLLAECYVRRDSVAVLGFRGRSAEVLLVPTRSLARAKRSLAELAGGGGTPLALGLDAARDVAADVRRRGDTPVVVVLSDGRANIARDGVGGRDRAEADARDAARRLGAEGVDALFIDTSPQPHALAREIADAMGALYLPLPHAGAEALSSAVRAVGATRHAPR